MNVYGITMDFKVIPVRLGSQEMMDCREVAVHEVAAKRRAVELRQEALNPDNDFPKSIDEEWP